jgi:germination protein M
MRKGKYIFLLLAIGIIFLFGCSLSDDKGQDNVVNTGVKDDLEVDLKDEAEEEVVENTQEEVETKLNPENTERLQITLYYQDRDGCVIPVTRKIVKQEGIARAAVGELIDSAINREEIEYFGLYPILPLGTEILGINIKEGIAVIDFNKKFLDYPDESAEKSIISSLVYTLTEFKTINGVKILVNGYHQDRLKFGTNVSGVLNRDNTLINSGSLNLKDGCRKVDVYLFKNLKTGNTYLIPVSVEYEKSEKDNKIDRIFELLAGEYADNYLYSEIPAGAELLSYNVKDSLLTLDFNDGLLEYGGRAREDGILKQILHSAKQIEGVQKVKILVNGDTANLPEGTDISNAVALPKTINNVIDH